MRELLTSGYARVFLTSSLFLVLTLLSVSFVSALPTISVTVTPDGYDTNSIPTNLDIYITYNGDGAPPALTGCSYKYNPSPTGGPWTDEGAQVTWCTNGVGSNEHHVISNPCGSTIGTCGIIFTIFTNAGTADDTRNIFITAPAPTSCDGTNTAAACPGSSWDTANNYCSSGICCPDSFYNNGGTCIKKDQCWKSVDAGGTCDYNPNTKPAGYFSDTGCVDTGITKCCENQGALYGSPTWYDYSSYTANAAGVNICGYAKSCSKSADTFCPNTYGASCGGPVAANCDEDCGAVSTWYRDADGDGWRTTATTSSYCKPAGYVAGSASLDCDDTNAALTNNCVVDECSINNDCTGKSYIDGTNNCHSSWSCNTGVSPTACVSGSSTYCPVAGTVTANTCYYGTRSCTNSGCGLSTAPINTATQWCHPVNGPTLKQCNANGDCTPVLTGNTCYYEGDGLGTCQADYTCSYASNVYCPVKGTVTALPGDDRCYYGTRSCTAAGCGLSTCLFNPATTYCNGDTGCQAIEVCGNNVREGSEVCDNGDVNGQTCVTQGFDSGTLGCNNCGSFNTTACNYGPSVDVFSATTSDTYAPVTATFTYTVSDDATGLDFMIAYGDGTDSGWFSDWPALSASQTDIPLSHTYQNVGTYVATITVRDTAGLIDTATAGTTGLNTPVVCNPGSPGGNPADQASNCCTASDASPSCFVGVVGNGACYSDGGAAVCIPNSDIVCTFPGGVPQTHDRDESQTYAVLATSTCSPVGWTDGVNAWCELGSCDTDDGVGGYACGDDVDESYFLYNEQVDFSGTSTSWLGCLNASTVDASTCFAIDKLDTPVRFSKSASENCAVTARDNDCNGAVPAYDEACYSSVDLQVWINDTQLGMQQARGADVAVTAFDPWVGVDLVLASYDVVTDLNGKKSFALVPPVDVDFSARYPDFDDDTVSQTIAAQQSGVPVSLVLQELSCTSSCTNAATNRCERLCLGVAAGCSLQTENQKLLMDACHPPQSTTGKREGELVILDRNETHRLVGVCCLAGATNPVWELAPKTDLVGDMSSLVKYTRLVRLDGLPVRLVVASWKPNE